MTAFEWTMITLTGTGLLITSMTVLIAATRGTEQIKQDTTQRIADEIIARNAVMDKLRQEMSDAHIKLRQETLDLQKMQYQDFGETCSALRRFIEEVEREMHRIEIWGRDNYVKQPEFQRAIDVLSTDLRDGFASVKSDIKSMRAELKSDIARNGGVEGS